MPKGNWKQDVKDMDFDRYDKIEKSGTKTLKFCDEGSVVLASKTGFKEDSVVFVVEENGKKKELWMSKLHPVLRELAGKEGDSSLTGKTYEMEFTGRGLQMRINVKKK